MTREEMRQKVRHLIVLHITSSGYTVDELADAAIAIIRDETLEEAARVVRRMPSPSSEWMADELLRALGGSANPVPAAIRALKEGK